jgi:hypothetical protein
MATVSLLMLSYVVLDPGYTYDKYFILSLKSGLTETDVMSTYAEMQRHLHNLIT